LPQAISANLRRSCRLHEYGTGAVGGLVSSLLFGYLVQSTGSYDAVLLSMVGMLIFGAGLWLRTDATQMLASPGTQTKQPALA